MPVVRKIPSNKRQYMYCLHCTCLAKMLFMSRYPIRLLDVKEYLTSKQYCGMEFQTFNSRTFYLGIRLFTFEKWPKMTIFQSKMDFLSANSRFAVQNDGTYLLRITRETCTMKWNFKLLIRPLWTSRLSRRSRFRMFCFDLSIACPFWLSLVVFVVVVGPF
jgi:hypothetical protein